MLLEVRLLGESVLTVRTTVRPRAIVRVHVTAQVTRRGKALRAARTLMWFVLIERTLDER